MFRPPEQSALVENLRLAENRGTWSEAEGSEDLQLELTDLKKQLEQREEALKQAHASMDTLTAELEELDRQNQEATQVCRRGVCFTRRRMARSFLTPFVNVSGAVSVLVSLSALCTLSLEKYGFRFLISRTNTQP